MSDAPPRPTRVATFPSGELAVAWSDGHESYFQPHALRCACRCAQCVEETSGRPLLDPSRVPHDVRPLEVLPVGQYAVSIRWSDGHETGIYTHRRLRDLCPCDGCSPG